MDDPKPPYTTVASVIRSLEHNGYLNSKSTGCICIYLRKAVEASTGLNLLYVSEINIDNKNSQTDSFAVYPGILSEEELPKFPGGKDIEATYFFEYYLSGQSGRRWNGRQDFGSFIEQRMVVWMM